MELELKHIAPYLPYGLQMTKNGFIGILQTVYLNKDMPSGYIIKVSCSDWLENDKKTDNIYKPLLLPLSKLNEDNISYLQKIASTDVEMEYIEDCIVDYYGINSHYKTELAPFTIFSKLLEWHFDVFGLIEAGLAIDKTTISKE